MYETPINSSTPPLAKVRKAIDVLKSRRPTCRNKFDYLCKLDSRIIFRHYSEPRLYVQQLLELTFISLDNPCDVR